MEINQKNKYMGLGISKLGNHIKKEVIKYIYRHTHIFIGYGFAVACVLGFLYMVILPEFLKKYWDIVP